MSSAKERLGPWFHNLHLPDGSETAPDHALGDFPAFKWARLAKALPANLDGWTALDIGCNAGFYAFELARRGARVMGIDSNPRYLKQAIWARRIYGLNGRVRFQRADLFDFLSARRRFDLILFMGVFYHLRYPLLGLDLAAQMARRILVFQSLSLPREREVRAAADYPITQRAALAAPGWPKMAFVERRFAGDPTNWWIPNRAGILAMVRSSGMRVTAEPLDETYLCRPTRARRSPDAFRAIRRLIPAGRVRR